MHNEISNKMGKVARQRRKALGLTQEAAGNLAGCGRLFVSQFENGKAEVRLDKALDLLQALGLEMRLASGPRRLVVVPND
jgi:y4mF family transcriptional regulator